ncbi:protein TAPETUM DETERMINANT 1-like isoform X2 [Humulus lupulus]|uniref:protein TAPETUM DETERMINANT 1-like isoform X2 n=1 Tax=Humulus lupulus TaxID=3486 RepID=UPI002B40B4B1|nr:protein TAPETUM DETERMINANT 1-like isoform X2 [Humulus lupulus]
MTSTQSSSTKVLAAAVPFFTVLFLFITVSPCNFLGHERSSINGELGSLQSRGEGGEGIPLVASVTGTTEIHRKLLSEKEASRVEPDRIRGDESAKCSISDITVSQSPTDPMWSGIPTYTVEIVNNCFTGCNISRIHLKCGWFSSDTFVNPKIFKRLNFDDCLVKDGGPLLNGGVLNFKYATTRPFPLSVSSVKCH